MNSSLVAVLAGIVAMLGRRRSQIHSRSPLVLHHRLLNLAGANLAVVIWLIVILAMVDNFTFVDDVALVNESLPD